MYDHYRKVSRENLRNIVHPVHTPASVVAWLKKNGYTQAAFMKELVKAGAKGGKSTQALKTWKLRGNEFPVTVEQEHVQRAINALQKQSTDQPPPHLSRDREAETRIIMGTAVLVLEFLQDIKNNTGAADKPMPAALMERLRSLIHLGEYEEWGKLWPGSSPPGNTGAGSRQARRTADQHATSIERRIEEFQPSPIRNPKDKGGGGKK